MTSLLFVRHRSGESKLAAVKRGSELRVTEALLPSPDHSESTKAMRSDLLLVDKELKLFLAVVP